MQSAVAEIDLQDYVLAGYFVARYATGGFWKSPLMPEQVISLSSCISKTVNVYWGWDVDHHHAKILDFGIPEDKLTAFQKWSGRKDIGHPNVFYSLEAAQQFIADFLPNDKNLLLLGAGLPANCVDRFLLENPLWYVDIRGTRRESEPFGVHVGFRNGERLSAGGIIRGF